LEAQRSGEDAITVQWETLSETNNAGFEVQRAAASADGPESFSEAVTIARQVTEAELLPTYPNPARSQATVRFAVPDRQAVRITLYDLLGRRVQTVVNTDAEGRTEAQLDVSGLASGTYFLRMQTEGHIETQRITVVR
jgi:hypothetical protein